MGWSASVVKRFWILLEVPQRNRTAGTFRCLAKVMAELGWSAVRVRDFNRRGYKEQIRGYCRDAETANRATELIKAAFMHNQITLSRKRRHGETFRSL